MTRTSAADDYGRGGDVHVEVQQWGDFAARASRSCRRTDAGRHRGGCDRLLGQADFLYRFEDGLCPMCTRAHLAAIADDRIQLPLLRKPDDRMYGVLWKDVLDSDDDLAMNETSTLARDVLLTEHVVTAVETAAPHAGEIDAIALAADAGGMSYYFHVGSSTNGDAFDVESMIQPGGGGLMSVATFESSVSAVAPSSSATALGRTDAIVVYSRTMGGAFVLGGQDAWGSPVYAVDYVPLYDGPQSLTGWLYGEVLAATLTRPSTPSEYASGTASPSFLWTVERDPEMGDVRIAVREITRDEIGAPVFAIPIDAGDDAYALSTAWDSPDTVLLTASNRTTGQWGLAELGGFLPCVTGLGGYDDSCFVIRAHLRRGAQPGHLFRGIYAEHDALVIPSGALDDASAEWRVRADRARKPELGVAPPIVAGDLRAWWAQ